MSPLFTASFIIQKNKMKKIDEWEVISLGAIVGIYQFNNESVQGNHIYIMMKELQKFLVDDAVLWQQKIFFSVATLRG